MGKFNPFLQQTNDVPSRKWGSLQIQRDLQDT